jgi:FMN phosphatase YigB (HAD superfamily)
MHTVIFDLGETLVDETRQWATAAKVAGVPMFTLSAAIGAVIERRLDHTAAFTALGIPRVTMAESGYAVTLDDFYPDALPTLRALKDVGYSVGIVANQPAGVAEQLEAMGLELDVIATSATYGVAKPDRRFFERIVADVGRPPGEIVYVGDRLDNDILPALAVGMHAVFLRRGPWGYAHARWPEAATITHRIDALTELPAVLRTLEQHPRPQ